MSDARTPRDTRPDGVAGRAPLAVRTAAAADRAWIAALVRERWGDEIVVSRGAVHRPAELPAFVAELDGERVGLATYRLDGEACELVTLDSLREGAGVGGALVVAVAGAARAAGCRRLWLITTNDNLHALRFYQRRGLVLKALHPGAIAGSRRKKPSIPEIGLDGIPLRDEIELELALRPDTGGER
jgi:N-acetylglutamate synthase-like GNAT family acetyltransferase